MTSKSAIEPGVLRDRPTRDEPSPAAPVKGKSRSVERVHRSTNFHWVGNGFYVSTYFPSQDLPPERVSPFVLMDYGPPREFPSLAHGKRGVGWHPHRGFETVTLAWEGSVAHRDNAGHSGVIGPGDVQWMTAAAGIFHEEYHEAQFTRGGGRMHMMQLWVNLPKRHKGAVPAYQPILARQIPTVELEGGGEARVIAGELFGTRGPARTFTPITMLDVRLREAGRLSVPLPPSFNALAVVTQGRVRAGRLAVGGEHHSSNASETTGSPASAGTSVAAREGELILFANDAAKLELSAEKAAHVIVLAGEPLNEPIVQYGPFVMNALSEIEQAIADVEGGKFGPVPLD